MCQLQGMTKDVLQALTKNQLIQMALEWVTYPDITTREFDTVTGEVVIIKVLNRDAFNNDIVNGQRTKKKYFDAPDAGIIHKIWITNYGAGGVETNHYCIVHNRNGGVKEVTQEVEG
jgi:hypothetical protein